MDASGTIEIALPSAFSMFCLVLLQAENWILPGTIVLEMLDAILHRRGVGPQHMQAGTIGDDIDADLFVPGAVIFDHVGGVVQHHVHDLRIVLVDLDRNMMRFAVGGRPD